MILKEANISPDLSPHQNTSKKPQPQAEAQPEAQPEPGPLTNKIIVLSDFKTATLTKKEFTKQLTDLGAIVEDNLTKNTNILVPSLIKDINY